MQGAKREIGRKERFGLAVFTLCVALLTVPAWGQEQGQGAVALHGYLDNFTILRNSHFADDYHIASSRYRASIQVSGSIPWLQDIFNRFEYFAEFRPEYESCYDICNRFGTGRPINEIAVSGRGNSASKGPNDGLLRAFGYNPHNFGNFWPHHGPLFQYNLVPGE